MKRNEVVIKMARYYAQKSCMVEQGYIDNIQFSSDMLEIAESMGMRPSYNAADDDEVDSEEWEQE